MDPKDTIDYVMGGMKWLAIGGGTYTLALFGAQLISSKVSKKIKSKQDLERIVKDEAEKLEITEKICVRYYAYRNKAEARMLEDKTYRITLGGYFSTVNDVRHELYHIYKHLDSPTRNWLRRKRNQKPSNTKRLFYSCLKRLNYLFREEFQATTYELFGLKL